MEFPGLWPKILRFLMKDGKGAHVVDPKFQISPKRPWQN